MSVSTNEVETYIKEQLAIEIQRFIATNVQLITDKMKIERTKVNLKANKTQLLKEKNSLVVKKKKLRIEIVVINIVEFFNVLICNYQNLFLKPIVS